MSEVVVVAGMSGAGRSTAGNNLEDLGWFVMDNLPPALIPKVAELADGSGTTGDRLALVVGTGRQHEVVVPLIGDLRQQVERLQLVFLDASTEILVRRYESSRRRHPFEDVMSGTLTEVIEAERQALEPLRAEADLVIDTTDLNVHQLRSRMEEAFSAGGSETAMRTTVTSFGYKHGIPLDVDLVFDCRFCRTRTGSRSCSRRRGSTRPLPTMCWSNRSRVRSWRARTIAGTDPSVLCAGGSRT